MSERIKEPEKQDKTTPPLHIWKCCRNLATQIYVPSGLLSFSYDSRSITAAAYGAGSAAVAGELPEQPGRPGPRANREKKSPVEVTDKRCCTGFHSCTRNFFFRWWRKEYYSVVYPAHDHRYFSLMLPYGWVLVLQSESGPVQRRCVEAKS